MASGFSIKAVNDWRGAVHVDLSRALRVSMDVWGKDAPNATKRMLIVMAQSARAMTPQAKKNRKVLSDGKSQYVEIVRNGEAKRAYRWQFDRGTRAGTWEGARSISGRGLAKRSWMWGLARAGKQSKPISGTSIVAQVKKGARTVGWQKTNRLSYIDEIMPAGYQRIAEQKAINKVMKQAETRMVRQFERRAGHR